MELVELVEWVEPMDRLDGGWYELVTRSARAGTYYRFRIDEEIDVPDPASRFQAHDVHGPSEVIDPLAWRWKDQTWRGRPWAEAVIYELHVGSFTPDGTFVAIEGRLSHLVDLGVTAIELMPIADFPGARNWGYDGALPYAPDSQYGSPDDLKSLIESAHALGLMVLLDVVYNHFGPEGNYLHRYAQPFFNDRRHTPWGAAINFTNPVVREFFIHNACYWLEEYRLDGLRLDAVHAIVDHSPIHILDELAARVRDGIGRARAIHLVLENDDNEAHYLTRNERGEPIAYSAQWNDDIHHVTHVLLTEERDGYYGDYVDAPAARLARCLSAGFDYQGAASPHRDGKLRGEPSAHLPPSAFISFLQNHDQIGNRPHGERITTLAPRQAVEAAAALLLLAPQVPLLFMGEEWGSRQAFPFFCDFSEELGGKVREGRLREFAAFVSDDASSIPDATAKSTFDRAILRWEDANTDSGNSWLALYRDLLKLRRTVIVPLLKGGMAWEAQGTVIAAHAAEVQWRAPDGRRIGVVANLGATPVALPEKARGRSVFSVPRQLDVRTATLPPWSTLWYVQDDYVSSTDHRRDET